jgi:hypothetical protein
MPSILGCANLEAIVTILGGAASPAGQSGSDRSHLIGEPENDLLGAIEN